MAILLDQLKLATEHAAQALGIPPDTHLPSEYGAVVWKYVLAEVLAGEYGGVGEIRRRARENHGLRRELAAVATVRLAELFACGRQLYHPTWSEWLEEDHIRRRIIELALDTLFSEPLGPETVLSPTPHALPAQPVYALIFTAFPHCAHELYPLLVDAYAANARWQVVGAHADWLETGHLRRAILFDIERAVLLEADFWPPTSISRAQVLALNLAEEADDHQRIESLLPGIPISNPYAGAHVLDDKAQVAVIWRHAGLSTPAFLVCANEESPAALEAFLAEFGPRLVVKPIDGTEGRDVELLHCMGRRLPAGPCLGRLEAGGPYLLMEERGSLRYHGNLRCVVRVNVCCDGRRAWAESGYAQVAATPDGIASAGRGGRVIPMHELWQQLFRPDGTRVTPTHADWQRLTTLAEAGALALASALGAGMPTLAGFDLLLDAGADGGIEPVLLEANPRPAGMSHSRFFSPHGPTDEPGVTLHLWEDGHP